MNDSTQVANGVNGNSVGDPMEHLTKEQRKAAYEAKKAAEEQNGTVPTEQPTL